jgi:hypothetical protein
MAGFTTGSRRGKTHVMGENTNNSNNNNNNNVVGQKKMERK